MKRIFWNLLILTFGFSLFAQNASNRKQDATVEEEIELPDVTTVVNGKTFTAGKDSVPDYSAILPETDSPEVQLPAMDGVKTPKSSIELGGSTNQREKDIYAEGELGAGYPFYFKGDFSIYRASGSSPFEIDFSHESAEGFARKKANEGFFARETAVRGKKSFFGEYGEHRIQAEYKMADDGLQLRSDSYSDTVKHTIFMDAGSDWQASNGILVSYGANGAWFNRYGEVMKDSVTSENYIDSTKILDLNPFFGIGWTNDSFKAMFTTFYGLQANLDGEDNLLKAENSSSAERSHRGEFNLALSWKNDFLSLGASGSLIVGTATGSKEVVPAFTLSSDFKTESFTEGRFITLSLRGGIDSYQEKIRTLENKFRFSVVPAIPTETTDWFAKIDLSVPILNSFEAKTGFEFRKTAFENGAWQAVYSDSHILTVTDETASQIHNFGLYAVLPEERTEFNTNLGFYADFAPFKAGAEWKSYWNDVPSLEDEQKIKLSLEYQSADTKWNAGTATIFAFGGDADKCPDISAWAGVRVAPALSLAFEVNDAIKLFHGTSRDWAHSQYITTSGNAVLLAKFQF